MKRAAKKPTPRARGVHPKPDPIFAAIEAHSNAEAVFEKALDALDEAQRTRKGQRTAGAREDKTSKASCEFLKRLCRTRPATAEGLVAMLDHLQPFCAPQLNRLYFNGATNGLWERITADVKRLTAGARQ